MATVAALGGGLAVILLWLSLRPFRQGMIDQGMADNPAARS